MGLSLSNEIKQNRSGIIPALSLLSGGDLSNHLLVDVSRASSKWYFDKDGSLKEASANTLPTSFDPNTGEKLGWYIEEARTNLNSNPNDLTEANYNRDQVSVSLDVSESLGDLNMFRVTENSNNADHQIIDNSASVSVGTVYTVSLFAKAGERRYLTIGGFGTWNNSQVIQFDLSTGEDLSIGSDFTSDIEHVGNGIYRCSFTYEVTGSHGIYARILESPVVTPTGDSNFGDYQGDGTSGLWMGGFQVEEGEFLTSPILGSGANYTREADDARVTDMSWYNSNEGTLISEANSYIPDGTNSAGARSAPWQLYLDDGNNIRVNLEDSIQEIFLRGYVGGSPTGGLQLFPSFNLGQFYKTAWYTDTTNYGGTVDGDPVSADTENYSGVSFSTLYIGSCDFSGDDQEFLNGYLKKLVYFDERLTNNEIERYTK